MLNMKLICVGMIAMLLVSCTHKPIAQKEDKEDFPTLKMEKVFSHQSDVYTKRPLLLQGNQYFYRNFDFKSHLEHYVAVNIDTKEIQWDKTYPDLEFTRTLNPQLIQDLVLFPSTNGDKYAFESKILTLNIEDGSKRWACNIVGYYGSMTLIKKTLFISASSHLYALDFQTGKLLWSKSIYDFFPGFLKEKEEYRIIAMISNQNVLFLGYTLEKDITDTSRTNYQGCLVIQTDNGSILWKYEKEYRDWAGIEDEDFEIIGPNLLAFGFTLLDCKNGKMLWQYKPENPEYKKPKTYYIGYIASEQLLIYQTNREAGYNDSNTSLSGLDIQNGQQKWKQEVNVKGNPNYDLSSYTVDQNHQTDLIFTLNSKDVGSESQINILDVYDSKDGKLPQSYEMPVPCWFRVLKSEIRFHQGWWYFIGTSSTDGGDQDNLFRFQLSN